MNFISFLGLCHNGLYTDVRILECKISKKLKLNKINAIWIHHTPQMLELYLTPDIVIQEEGFLEYKAGALKYTNYKRLCLVR